MIDLLTNYTKKKVFVIVFICAVVLYVDVAFLLQMQLGSLKSAGPKIKKLQKDLSAMKKDLAEMRKLKKEQVPAIQEAGAQRGKLISAEQIPSLLEEISKIANKHNVKIMQISSAKESKGGAEEVKPKGGKAPKQDKYSVFTITMDVSCAYHNLGSFLSSLDSLDAIIDVREMRIASESKNYLDQKVNIELLTYVTK